MKDQATERNKTSDAMTIADRAAAIIAALCGIAYPIVTVFLFNVPYLQRLLPIVSLVLSLYLISRGIVRRSPAVIIIFVLLAALQVCFMQVNASFHPETSDAAVADKYSVGPIHVIEINADGEHLKLICDRKTNDSAEGTEPYQWNYCRNRFVTEEYAMLIESRPSGS